MSTYEPNADGGISEHYIDVDLDGTLAVYEKGDGVKHGALHIGPPVPAVLKRVKAALAEGRKVRIFTARVDGGLHCAPTSPLYDAYRDVDRMRAAIEDWCLEHIGEVLPVSNKKDYATSEIWDDRAVSIERNTGRVLTRHRRPLLAQVWPWVAAPVLVMLAASQGAVYAFARDTAFWQGEAVVCVCIALGALLSLFAASVEAPWKKFR